MKVLVTGAGGFVGSHLVEQLVAQGDEVVALTFSKDKTNYLDTSLPVQHEVGDIRDAAFVKRIMNGCKGVYHQAAALNDYHTTPHDFISTNILGTRNVMQAAFDAGVKKVVHTSSMAAIKENQQRINEEYQHSEMFDGYYSMTKYKGEKIAFEYGARGMDVTVLNPTIIYGPRETHTLGQIFKRHIEGKVRIGAFLGSPLNLIHVRDAAKGNILAMNKGKAGHRYLLGGDEVSMGTFLHLLDEITGTKKPLLRVPDFAVEAGVNVFAPLFSAVGLKFPLLKPQVAAMKRGAAVDVSKARKELGVPTTPLREGLKETLEWYKEKGYIRY